MWIVSGNSLQMTEGDFGLLLPVKINGTTLTEHDSIKFTFKDKPNGATVLEKQ